MTVREMSCATPAFFSSKAGLPPATKPTKMGLNKPCPFLPRQRSEVRIPSGAPAKSKT